MILCVCVCLCACVRACVPAPAPVRVCARLCVCFCVKWQGVDERQGSCIWTLELVTCRQSGSPPPSPPYSPTDSPSGEGSVGGIAALGIDRGISGSIGMEVDFSPVTLGQLSNHAPWRPAPSTATATPGSPAGNHMTPAGSHVSPAHSLPSWALPSPYRDDSGGSGVVLPLRLSLNISHEFSPGTDPGFSPGLAPGLGRGLGRGLVQQQGTVLQPHVPASRCMLCRL